MGMGMGMGIGKKQSNRMSEECAFSKLYIHRIYSLHGTLIHVIFSRISLRFQTFGHALFFLNRLSGLLFTCQISHSWMPSF